MIHKTIPYRRMQEIRHKKKLANQHNRCSALGVSFVNGHYVNSGRGKRSAYIKRVSNKKVRRSQGLFQNSEYRRLYDYWWEMI